MNYEREIARLTRDVAELRREVANIPSRLSVGGGGGGAGTAIAPFVIVSAVGETLTGRRILWDSDDQRFELAEETVEMRAAPGSVVADYGGRLQYGPGTGTVGRSCMPVLGVQESDGIFTAYLPLKPFGGRSIPDDVDTSG